MRSPDTSSVGVAAVAQKRARAAACQRKSRSRRTRGVVVLHIQVREHAVAEALIAAGRLTEDGAVRRGLVEREISRLVAEWASRWLRPR
jgi:hypothetical protein